MKSLTVGELKRALECVPDDTVVRLTSDTGVDQGHYGDIIVEDAYPTHYVVGNHIVDFFRHLRK